MALRQHLCRKQHQRLDCNRISYSVKNTLLLQRNRNLSSVLWNIELLPCLFKQVMFIQEAVPRGLRRSLRESIHCTYWTLLLLPFVVLPLSWLRGFGNNIHRVIIRIILFTFSLLQESKTFYWRDEIVKNQVKIKAFLFPPILTPRGMKKGTSERGREWNS